MTQNDGKLVEEFAGQKSLSCLNRPTWVTIAQRVSDPGSVLPHATACHSHWNPRRWASSFLFSRLRGGVGGGGSQAQPECRLSAFVNNGVLATVTLLHLWMMTAAHVLCCKVVQLPQGL